MGKRVVYEKGEAVYVILKSWEAFWVISYKNSQLLLQLSYAINCKFVIGCFLLYMESSLFLHYSQFIAWTVVAKIVAFFIHILLMLKLYIYYTVKNLKNFGDHPHSSDISQREGEIIDIIIIYLLINQSQIGYFVSLKNEIGN